MVYSVATPEIKNNYISVQKYNFSINQSDNLNIFIVSD